MEVEILSGKKMTKTESESIRNNIKTLASTPYGTAPFIRDMGIKDYPPQDASEIKQNSYAAEVITQARIWEDRAKVSEVSFDEGNRVKVVISSNG